MSTIADLPKTAKRFFRKPTRLGLSGVGTPGMVADSDETWLVPIPDRPAFLYTVIGTAQVVGGPSGAMVRIVPLQHPEAPALYATGATSEAAGYDAGAKFWSHCLITVHFESRPFPLSGQDAYLTRAGQPASRSIPAPAVIWRMGPSGPAPVFDPGLDIQGEDFTISINEVPSGPTSFGYFDAIRNTVNQGAWQGRPDGTVLYRGMTYTATSNLQGISWSYSHSFSYSEVPWNQYFLPDGTLVDMYRPDGTLRILKSDFSPLLNI